MKKYLFPILTLILTAPLLAQVPQLVNYQGRLTGSGTNFNGPGWFKFAIVQPGVNLARQATATAVVTAGGVTAITVTDGGSGYTAPPSVMITGFPGPQWGGATAVATVGSGGMVTAITVQTSGSNYNLGAFVTVAPPPPDYTVTTYWNNNGSIFDTEPTLPVPVPVADGLFNVTLGKTPMAYLDPFIFTNSDLHLRIWFSANATNYQRLTPDQQLTATPYALLAANAVNVVGILPASALSGIYGGVITLSNTANNLAGSGSGLTALNAAHLESGTVGDSRLSSNVALLNGNQTFSGSNNFTNGSGAAGSIHVGGYLANGDPKLIHFGDMQGNGLGYVYLGENGVDDRLELRAGSIFFNTGYVGVGLTNPAFSLDVAGTVRANSFMGNASGLTNLNAASLASGTVAGTLTFSPPSGPPFAVGNSNMVPNLNAALLGGLSAGDIWQLGGNSGTTANNFLGTKDDQPLELRANNARGLRLQYTSRNFGQSKSVNVVGGYAGNTIPNTVLGGVIAGGGDIVNQVEFINSVTGDFGSVGGGYDNTAGVNATVPGGIDNTASGASSFAAGQNNTASGAGSFALGRNAHATHANTFLWSDGAQTAYSSGDKKFEVYATGGINLQIGTNSFAAGRNNTASGVDSFALGLNASATHANTFLWSDGGQSVSSSGDKKFEVYAAGGVNLQVGTNAIVSDAQKGISLDAGDLPLITRGFDRFGGSAGAKSGLGRWGLFLENSSLTLGIPATEVGPRQMEVARYRTDGTRDTLFSVANDGNTYFSSNVTVATLTIRGGADIAEPFAMSEDQITQGSVVVIDAEHPGQLKLSTRAYDTGVAGIVSGANGIRPGISISQEGVNDGGRNVALSGRVYAQADATESSIKPGDLLTTSAMPGCVMKVTDPAKAQGAIVGKAMTGLKTGKGLVLVLVTLQ